MRTYKAPVLAADLAHAERLFERMEAEGAETLRRAGETSAPTFARSVDIRYVGQGYEINVPLPPGRLDEIGGEALLAQFREAYERLFGRAFPDNQFEIVNLRVVASGREPASPLKKRDASGEDAFKGERRAYAPEARAYVDYKVYDRYRLAAGSTVEGPAIFEEREATTVIGPGGTARVDEYGLLRIGVA